MAREMKNSGVRWIGEIPDAWSISKIKHNFGIISGCGFSDRYQGETTGDYPFCKASDINGMDKTVSSAANFVSRDVALRERYNIIPVNSILFAKIGEALKKNHRKINTVECIVDNNCQALYQKEDNDIHYMYYLFKQIDMTWFDNAGTIPCVNNLALKNFFIPIPPLAEQKVIADFLDAKCGEIDGLLSDLDAEVKTLTEYKKSIIAETVTRGLNPNAPMKKVSLGWIDELPANWSVARIASVYSVRNEKVSDQDYQPLSVTMKGIVPQLENAAKTKHGDDRKLIRKGDFVINSRSDRRGSCGISPYDGSCSLINTVLAPREEMNPRYYNWLFHTTQFADEFYKWGYGIVDDLWTTNWGAMRRIQIPMPSLEEQAEIAAYLDKKVPQIDETIALKQDQIETLKAYKSSLIYEYVTGKKQVL